MTENSDSLWILGILGIVGVGILLSLDTKKVYHRKPRLTKSLEGTSRIPPAATLTREESSAPEDKKKLECVIPTRNHPVPNFSTNVASTISRSEKYSASEICLVSKKIANSKTPVINSSESCLKRKYPPNYYQLSPKAQWKFRKNVNHSQN